MSVCLLALLAGAHLGCSEEARYSVLSFFFDGVPKPGEDAEAPEPDDLAATAPAPGVREGPIVSVHEPYADRSQCFECHGEEIAAPTAALRGEMCRKCHGQHFAAGPTDWVHGPAAVGGCLVCHEHHESRQAGLLKAPQQDLCSTCHGEGLLNQPYHAEIGQTPCSTCHDPHLAGNRLLLADARTFARAKVEAKRSIHEPWKEQQCGSCHLVREAFKVVDDIEGACRKCHEKDLAVPSGRVPHAPVRQGKCTLCHVSHHSPLPHLLRPSDGESCYSCHDRLETSGGNHPRVEKVNCLLCHAGHSSPRAKLLNPGIPRPGQPAPPPESPPATRPSTRSALP